MPDRFDWPVEDRWAWLNEEHRRLEAILDDVAGMLAEETIPRERLDNIVLLLNCYASRHFRHEEEFFASLLPEDDPDRKRNEAEHRSFRDWLEAFLLRYREAGDGELRALSQELQQKLRRWLEDHTLAVDRRLAEKCRLPP